MTTARAFLAAALIAAVVAAPASAEALRRIPLSSNERVRTAAGTHTATWRGAFLGTAAGLVAAIASDEATGARNETMKGRPPVGTPGRDHRWGHRPGDPDRPRRRRPRLARGGVPLSVRLGRSTRRRERACGP